MSGHVENDNRVPPNSPWEDKCHRLRALQVLTERNIRGAHTGR